MIATEAEERKEPRMADGSSGIGHNGGPSIELPEKLIEVFANPDGSWRSIAPDGAPVRYRVLFGGRGGSKSWGVARLLIGIAAGRRIRVLCAREYQVSIADSVHKLLADQIDDMGLSHLFTVTEKSIYCHVTDAEFIFKGLRKNIREIKSLEGIDYVWVEEAQAVSQESWQILRPTIRKPSSEIWITFNPDSEEDATYRMFVTHPPAGTILQRINYRDNPWFPEELNRERLSDLNNDDPDAYQWIWEGECRRVSDAIIFRRRVVYAPFIEPTDPPPRMFYYGADWGFANDPAALVRFYITEEPNPDAPNHPHEHLWITHEAFGYQVEIDDLDSKVFDRVPGVRQWPIKADSARPEIISYMARRGFNITAAEKWPGSVEDGVDHLKGFRAIHIDEKQCPNLAREFRLYSYKTDPTRVDEKGQPLILPVIVDKHNHGIDAIRYGLDGVIQRRGGLGVWAKLAK